MTPKEYRKKKGELGRPIINKKCDNCQGKGYSFGGCGSGIQWVGLQ